MRIFWFVLFQIEMFVIFCSAIYVVSRTFGTLNRIESKVDGMRAALGDE